jgi:hypothetical protein
MELTEPCRWVLIKFGDEFGVQYGGPDPDINFRSDMTGIIEISLNDNK